MKAGDVDAVAVCYAPDAAEMGQVDGGDARTMWGTFKIAMVSKADGKSVTERGRFKVVTRKLDGHWMYVVDHASDDPAPAAH